MEHGQHHATHNTQQQPMPACATWMHCMQLKAGPGLPALLEGQGPHLILSHFGWRHYGADSSMCGPKPPHAAGPCMLPSARLLPHSCMGSQMLPVEDGSMSISPTMASFLSAVYGARAASFQAHPKSTHYLSSQWQGVDLPPSPNHTWRAPFHNPPAPACHYGRLSYIATYTKNTCMHA